MLITLTPCKSSKSNQSCKSSKSSKSMNFKFYHFYIDYLLCKSYKPLSGQHFQVSFTTFTSFTGIEQKQEKSRLPLSLFNAYIQCQRLFPGALILQYEIAVFFKASKVLALRLLAIQFVTQKRRELLKTAILWSLKT